MQELVKKMMAKCQQFGGIGKLIAGCVLSMFSAMGGIPFLFFREIKHLFHLPQIQIEIMSGLYLVGIYFVLPYALVLKKYGFYVTFAVGSLLTSAGCLLLAMASMMPDNFKGLTFLLHLFMFALMTGRCCLFFLISITALTKVAKAYRGKAVGIATSSTYVGELIHAAIYKQYFQDTSKTWVFFLTCFGVISAGLVFFILVYIVTGEAGQEEQTPMINTQSQINYHSASSSSDVKSPSAGRTSIPKHHKCSSQETELSPNADETDLTLAKILTSAVMHLYTWSGAIILSSLMIYSSNYCLILQSLKLKEYELVLLAFWMIFTLAFGVTFGVLYDSFTKVSHRAFLLTCATTTTSLCFLIPLFKMDSMVTVIISTLCMACALGGGLPVYFAFSMHIFGKSNIEIVQGVLMTCYVIFSLIFSSMTGAIYDSFVSESENEDNITCYGTECYWWAWLVMFCFSLPAFGFSVMLYYYFRNFEEP